MIEMNETSIAVDSSDGLVQIRLDSSERSDGMVTLRFHPEAAGMIARAMNHCACVCRATVSPGDRDLRQIHQNECKVEVSVSPDDMVLLRFRPPEPSRDVYMNPGDADNCASEMLVAAEAARTRRIQKETN